LRTPFHHVGQRSLALMTSQARSIGASMHHVVRKL